ncbi:TIGR01620 family protein [Vespertiliibacter pulmonis]|uniref:UPF0283 membrane protein EDC46_0075 n=1 Tax=Vespertiliibacter pulmonis TaxID=1443036 RepID=A0A3N4W838_9PAST|nr:TIGR01620 family protein [Vespertiliibacter pulmonis]QLB21289.1 TIGR01620 family protein [Vespertiliibacter pulmonis]RPE85697.1 putative membrane protein [Vespertiliibacter pulmonis]
MEKRIFEQEIPIQQDIHQPKREFDHANIKIEKEIEESEVELIIDEMAKPSRFWVRVLLGVLVLFSFAVLAQSVQWLIDTWQMKNWIYFAFAVSFFIVSLVGIGAMIAEWRKLVWLRKHYHAQQESLQLLAENQPASGDLAITFCKSVLSNLDQSSVIMQGKKRWLAELDEAYNAQEVLFLFSQNILQPIDKQVKKLISQSSVENAIIVAISPLAIVDVLMMAWRNIALVNKITKMYGMELGYFSRLKLFKMVLTNMVFAGATEIATDIGMEFFSQNLTAKLSMRAAQGIGAGLLTARLGIKAMEFCRPVVFSKNERPKLSVVRQELLSTLKERVFNKLPEKERELG